MRCLSADAVNVPLTVQARLWWRWRLAWERRWPVACAAALGAWPSTKPAVRWAYGRDDACACRSGREDGCQGGGQIKAQDELGRLAEFVEGTGPPSPLGSKQPLLTVLERRRLPVPVLSPAAWIMMSTLPATLPRRRTKKELPWRCCCRSQVETLAFANFSQQLLPAGRSAASVAAAATPLTAAGLRYVPAPSSGSAAALAERAADAALPAAQPTDAFACKAVVVDYSRQQLSMSSEARETLGRRIGAIAALLEDEFGGPQVCASASPGSAGLDCCVCRCQSRRLTGRRGGGSLVVIIHLGEAP